MECPTLSMAWSSESSVCPSSTRSFVPASRVNRLGSKRLMLVSKVIRSTSLMNDSLMYGTLALNMLPLWLSMLRNLSPLYMVSFRCRWSSVL